MSIANELERLAALQERGVISADEFARVKARLIDGDLAADGGVVSNVSINRLRRSRTDRWLGGVCGGLARLTDVETWVWRLGFALSFLFWGFGLVLYILLWVFVPDE